MFDFTRDARNVFFFDSDSLAKKVGEAHQRGANRALVPDMYLTGPKGNGPRSNNGVHISPDLRRLITTELVNSIGWLASVKSERFRGPGWLCNVTVKSGRAG